MTDTAEPQTQPSQQNAQAQQPQQSSQQSKHMMTPREKKWIVYDVGNSAFVLLSTAVVPIYANSLLKAAGETNIVSTWGYAQTIASLVIAVLMPLLGSIADVQGMKIRFFTGFFLTGVVMCCAMAMPLGWLAFIIVYVLATIGLNGSLTFYDSMLVDTTSNERMDRISSHGYAWGYIGSTVPFIVCIALIFGGPALFGWSTTACTRASFVITALWWVAFTIPLLTSYKQVHYRATAGQAGEAIRGTFAELGSTFRAIRKNKPLWMFMIAFFFYIDAVNTVISMSTSYGTQLGIDSTQASARTVRRNPQAAPLRPRSSCAPHLNSGFWRFWSACSKVASRRCPARITARSFRRTMPTSTTASTIFSARRRRLSARSSSLPRRR